MKLRENRSCASTKCDEQLTEMKTSGMNACSEKLNYVVTVAATLNVVQQSILSKHSTSRHV
jgi:hypothetical protein